LARLHGLQVFTGAKTSETNDGVSITGEGITFEREPRVGDGFLQTANRALEVEKGIPAARLSRSRIQFERAKKLTLGFRFIPRIQQASTCQSVVRFGKRTISLTPSRLVGCSQGRR
jgi:hypothetical protein